MRAVFDTNVLVSAILSPGATPAQIVAAWDSGAFELVTSGVLLHELVVVLRRPRIQARISANPEYAERFIARMEESAETVQPNERLAVVRDEADNRVLEAAVAGDADYIVSGDADLLDLGTYEGIEIVTPARFAAILSMPF